MEETTTPPEEVEENRNYTDRFLEHTITNTKSFSVLDRTGLNLSLSALVPLTVEESNERIWGGSVILNSALLEYPRVDFKLRVTAKRRFNPKLTCNRSKGFIEQNDIFVLTYQLPESSIEAVQLTLLIDSMPHEIPLCKYPKADYFWIGKETNVPGPAQLLHKRMKKATSADEPSLKNISPGRIENVPEGLKSFLLEGNGAQSMAKLLFPHCLSLFRDLSMMKIEQFATMEMFGNQETADVISEEIVARFHEANRQKFITTPALLQ